MYYIGDGYGYRDWEGYIGNGNRYNICVGMDMEVIGIGMEIEELRRNN
jgi:hypothetical protein